MLITHTQYVWEMEFCISFESVVFFYISLAFSTAVPCQTKTSVLGKAEPQTQTSSRTDSEMGGHGETEKERIM